MLAALTVCSALEGCSQGGDGLCTGMQAIGRILRDQCACMKYQLCAFLCVACCLALPSCSAGSSALLFASSSQSCESGPFSWGHTVVFLISYGPQWFCHLSSKVFEVVQSNTCIWTQWREKKGIGLWVRTKLGQVEGSRVDDFPGRRMCQCCFALQPLPWMILVQDRFHPSEEEGRDRS